MRKYGFIFLVVLLTLSVVACGKSEETSSTEQKNEKQKLILATSADYFPYEYIDTASGSEKILGFDIDVANLIAEELGFEIELKNMDFSGLLAALQTGQADFVMAGMTPNEERAKSVDFSKVYNGEQTGSNSIVALKSNNITSVEALNGKKVAAQLGTAQEQAAKKIEGIELVSLNKIPEIVQEVLAGRVDAAIIEDAAAQKYIDNYSQLGHTPYSAEGLNGVAVAFPKGSDKVEQFNQAIDHLKENGKLDELIEKWLKQK